MMAMARKAYRCVRRRFFKKVEVRVGLTEYQRQFGPDATLIGIADWLTEHHAFIDRMFCNDVGLFSIRITESLTQQHQIFEHESEAPAVKVAFADRTGKVLYYSDNWMLAGEAMQPRPIFTEFRELVGEAAVNLRPHFVACTEVFYHEVLWLLILRSGDVLGMLGYHALGNNDTRFDILEQYCRWSRREEKYVGEQIELRLRGEYIPHFLATEPDTQEQFRKNPALIYSSRETLPIKDNAYRALFQMKREPDQIQFGPEYISVIYHGENDALRNPGGHQAGARDA